MKKIKIVCGGVLFQAVPLTLKDTVSEAFERNSVLSKGKDVKVHLTYGGYTKLYLLEGEPEERKKRLRAAIAAVMAAANRKKKSGCRKGRASIRPRRRPAHVSGTPASL